MQIFSSHPTTGEASGWLRQELHELELLDDITNMTYSSILPKSINSDIRHLRINQYQDLKDHDYVPKNMSKAISWSSIAPLKQIPIEEPSQDH